MCVQVQTFIVLIYLLQTVSTQAVTPAKQLFKELSYQIN